MFIKYNCVEIQVVLLSVIGIVCYLNAINTISFAVYKCTKYNSNENK